MTFVFYIVITNLQKSYKYVLTHSYNYVKVSTTNKTKAAGHLPSKPTAPIKER